jgi:hypothetical protein
MTTEIDQQIPDGEEEYNPLFEFYRAPSITAPGSTNVTPGFDVDAVTYGSRAFEKYNIDFYRTNGTKIKRLSTGGGFLYLSYKTPNNLIPMGTQFYFKIQYKGVPFYSHWATSRTYTMASAVPARITSPSGGVVKVPRPRVTGTGAPGASIKLMQANVGTVDFGTTEVDGNRNWVVSELKASLPQADLFQLVASQVLNGQQVYSNTVSFTVLFKPVIESVTVSEGIPTVRGCGCLAGARLEIWLASLVGGVQLQTTVGEDGCWSVSSSRAWAAGRHTITARQFGPNSGLSSDLSDPYTFTVNAVQPTITPPSSGVVWVPRPRVTGTGQPGSVVSLYLANSGHVLYGRVTMGAEPTWVVEALREDLPMADPFNLVAGQMLNCE